MSLVESSHPHCINQHHHPFFILDSIRLHVLKSSAASMSSSWKYWSDFQHHRNTYPSRRGNLTREKDKFCTTPQPHARFDAIFRQLEPRKVTCSKSIVFLRFGEGLLHPPPQASKNESPAVRSCKGKGLESSSEKSWKIADFLKSLFSIVFLGFCSFAIIRWIHQINQFDGWCKC